jgi:hypothetical protein
MGHLGLREWVIVGGFAVLILVVNRLTLRMAAVIGNRRSAIGNRKNR